MKDTKIGRGGKRTGSGRKRIHSKGVSHRTREHVNRRVPLHINFKYKCAIRNKDCLKLLKRAILNARKQGLRILHFSLQHNHVHLIVEAETNEVLSSGMRSITVTMAMGLKRGKIQIARYHLHVLKGLREARNAVMYVLFNRQKHEKGTSSKIDGYTSVLMLENWKELVKVFVCKTQIRMSIEEVEEWFVDRPVSNLGKLAIKNPGLWPGFRMV